MMATFIQSGSEGVKWYMDTFNQQLVDFSNIRATKCQNPTTRLDIFLILDGTWPPSSTDHGYVRTYNFIYAMVVDAIVSGPHPGPTIE